MRRIKIIGTGKYLPPRVVKSTEIDQALGLSAGRAAQMSGVEERRYAQGELASEMGAFAIMAALEKSGIRYEDLDALVCASGTQEQPLPCTASLIQRRLDRPDHPLPCFDLNATCLSFVTAFDVVASLLSSGRFKNVAIVSTEIASVGLNPHQHEAYALFGDGAAAAIVTLPAPMESARLIHASMKTYSVGAENCQIQGGGTRIPSFPEGGSTDLFRFHMEGRKVFKLVLETMPDFYAQTLADAQLTTDQIDWIIPHQASASGMELVRRKLEIPSEKYVDILAQHGNMIAASIPLALHLSIESGRIQRGQKVLLLGTSAGMSLGIAIFEY